MKNEFNFSVWYCVNQTDYKDIAKMKLKQFIKYNADVEKRKCSVEHDRTFLILT